jgi:hypothetical protein
MERIHERYPSHIALIGKRQESIPMNAVINMWIIPIQADYGQRPPFYRILKGPSSVHYHDIDLLQWKQTTLFASRYPHLGASKPPWPQ